MGCLQNIITPYNPCLDSSPCKQNYSSDCVIFNGTLSCGGFGPNPTLTTVLKGVCLGLTNLAACATWTNITTFETGYEAFGTVFQVPQYSTVKDCIVRLRGIIKNEDFNSGDPDVLTLPVGKRPAAWRMFTINVQVVGNPDLVPCQLVITDTGIMTLAGNLALHDSIYFSLDGISFEV